MMAITAYELKKQLQTRLTVFALAAVLILNGAAAFRQARAADARRPVSGWVLAEIYAEYAQAPARLDEYYRELTEYHRSRTEVEKAAGEAGIEFIETRRSLWTDGLYTDDIELLNGLREFAIRQSGYPNEVAAYIRNAETNRKEFLKSGYTGDSYEVRNQEKAGELYAAVGKEVILRTVYINGWNDFYAFSLTGILSALMAVIIGTAVFIREKETGMLSILKSTRKGKAETACCKLLTAGFLSVLCAALLTAETWVVFALTEGFSGGAEALQSLDAFRKSPFIISIRGFLPLYFGQRMLAALLFTLTTALLAVCFYNYVLTFAASAAFTGLNLALYAGGTDRMQNTLRYTNLYSLAEGTRLYSRYASLDVSGHPVPYYTALPLFSLFFASVLFASAVLLFCRGGMGVEIGFLKTARAALRRWAEKLKNKRAGPTGARGLSHTLSLLRHETFKLTVASRLGIAALGLMVAGVLLFTVSGPFVYRYGYTDKLYYQMISDFSGEWNEDRHEAIRTMKEQYERIIMIHDYMAERVVQGVITPEEYSLYLRDYVVARRSVGAADQLFRHSQYLRERYEATGVRGCFLDDRGWQAYIFRSPDYCLYAAILILLAGCFSAEYGAKPMSAIMHPTPGGRRRVFLSKLFTVLILTSAMRTTCEIAALCVCAGKFGLPLASAPALSVEKLSALDGGISLFGLSMLLLLLRLFAALALGILVMSASCMLRRSLPAIAASASVTLIPALGEYSGLAVFAKADYLRLFEGGRLLLASIGREGRPDFQLLLSVLVPAAACAVLLALLSSRRFCERS